MPPNGDVSGEASVLFVAVLSVVVGPLILDVASLPQLQPNSSAVMASRRLVTRL